MLKQSSSDTSIKVVCRVRPLNELEKSQGGQLCVAIHDKTIKLKLNGDENKYDFSFDHVFSPETAQAQIFEAVARPVIESVMSGFNGTIFAYGQTSSGKTFTMEGPSIDSLDNKGIIPRMMENVFENILNANENLEFTVKVSFLEIYNEKIQDLLDSKKNNLSIKEDRNHGIYIQDATEVYVYNVEQMKKVMKTGAENRTIAATRMNERSSRSHSIFILSIFQKDILNETSKQSRLFFVDLAGSEKIAKTNVTGQQLEEAKNINKSLSALGNVINALTSEKKEYVPYRDSKLTRLLQDSLGGNSKTTLILACSPCAYNDKETLSTLRFGQRAKNIRNNPVVNEQKSVKELMSLLEYNEKKIKQQELFIEKLQAELNRRGIVDCESKILNEIEESKEISKENPGNYQENPGNYQENQENFTEERTPRETPRENSKETPRYSENTPRDCSEGADMANYKRYIANSSNNTMKLLRQHIHINQLNEQLKQLKCEKKELEGEITGQKGEIEELNERFVKKEEYYSELINKYIGQIQNMQVSFEKMFYENQSSSHLVTKLKRELNRLKTDFNFLLLSHSLKEIEKPQNNLPVSPRKREEISFDITKDFVEDQSTFFEKVNENIMKILSLIESIEEISTNICNYDYSALGNPAKFGNNFNNSGSFGSNFNGNANNFNQIADNNEISREENNSINTPVKVPMLNMRKVLTNQWESTTNTNRDYVEENESQENREFLALTERKKDDYEISLEIKTLNKGEKISKEMYESKMEKIKEIENYEEKIAEMQDLISNQRKTINSLTKMNQELTFTVESYNNVFEKKAEKYKKKMVELKEDSLRKQQETEKKIDVYEKLLAEKEKEYFDFKNKCDNEIVMKTNEICELKLHLDHLQQFLSANKETRFLMECEKKIKDLVSERQTLFNELFKLRSDLEEKSESIVEKSSQIAILQANVSTLLAQLEKYDYQKHSNYLPQVESSTKKDQQFPRLAERKSTDFIDKHIIRPLRGGGGNLKNFQKNNYLLEEESESSDQEIKSKANVNFLEFSFKKKKPDLAETKEVEAEVDVASALEEDLNLYYSKNQRNDVEKKFMKIQGAFLKKEETSSKGSMKNIFTSVKKLFS